MKTYSEFAHFCEYEVISEEMNLVACNICGEQPQLGVGA